MQSAHAPQMCAPNFLIESIVLSLTGGVIGIVLGALLRLIPKLFGWSTPVSPTAILVAVLFSAAVGISFGYYPARKAANLNPIEALRSNELHGALRATGFRF